MFVKKCFIKKVKKIITNNNNRFKEVVHPLSVVLHLPDSWSNWNLEFFRSGENWNTRRKTSRSKGENQQQTHT